MNTFTKNNQDLNIQGISVRNPEGAEVELASLWTDRRILIDFLRHFG